MKIAKCFLPNIDLSFNISFGRELIIRGLRERKRKFAKNAISKNKKKSFPKLVQNSGGSPMRTRVLKRGKKAGECILSIQVSLDIRRSYVPEKL